jgi:hypothetical protein
MSFLGHEQIYQSDVFSVCAGAKQWPASPRPHRLDESATGYSLAGCSPALPASASPAVFHAAPDRRKQSSATETGQGTFRSDNNISALDNKKALAEPRSARYNNLCPGFGPLAGFEVIMSGRI